MRTCPSRTVTSTFAAWNAARTSAIGLVAYVVTIDDRFPGGVNNL